MSQKLNSKTQLFKFCSLTKFTNFNTKLFHFNNEWVSQFLLTFFVAGKNTICEKAYDALFIAAF